MKAALLSDRSVVRIAGEDARKFLNGLLTADMSKVAAQAPRFAALLTPQGKIITDFIVAEIAPENGSGFVLDCPRELAPTLLERLRFYRLRAKITIEDASEALAVLAIWNGTSLAPADTAGGPDPRLPELGLRLLLPPAQAARAAGPIEPGDYETHRIALGVPRGGLDFAYGDAFPHEADVDQLHGIDFDKGCFVGQEVVSRMEHRGSVRTRVVPVALDGPAPAPGSAVTAAGKAVGQMGSAAGGRGLAALRLDRVEEALASGASLACDSVALRLIKPAWARFRFPGEPRATE
jgi:folate-binding protein YgfZ